MDVHKFPILLGLCIERHVQYRLSSCLDRKIGSRTSQIRFQPLPISQVQVRGDETYTRTNSQKGKALFAIGLGVLYGQHIQTGLGDLIRWDGH